MKKQPKEISKVTQQVVRYAFQTCRGDITTTALVMKRSVAEVESYLHDVPSKAHGRGSHRSLDYAHGYEKWLVRFLTQRAERGQLTYTKEVQRAWHNKFKKDISLRTLQRVFRDLGVGFKVQKVERKLSLKHKTARVKFAMDHVNFDFGQVMFTDAHTLRLSRIAHSKGRRTMAPSGVTPKLFAQKNPPCIKVYAGLTKHGCTELVEVTGTTDLENAYETKHGKHACKGVSSMEYSYDVLPRLLAEGKRLFKGGSWTFQQDGDGAHTAKATLTTLNEWTRDMGIDVMLDWPSMSPDLSPIENLWALLDMKVLHAQPTTLGELRKCMYRAWAELGRGVIPKRLVESMPRRMDQVRKKKGEMIRY